MTSYHIRPAVTEDIPALNTLIGQSVRDLNAADYHSHQIESALQYVYGVDTQLIEDGTYFVAVADGRLVGCGGWSQRKTLFGGDQAKENSNEDSLLDPKSEAAKIRAFFVHPAFARQGIGRALMDAAEFAAVEAGFSRLELVATLTGEPLYAQAGFDVIERFTVTLPDDTPFDVARMAKSINSKALLLSTLRR